MRARRIMVIPRCRVRAGSSCRRRWIMVSPRTECEAAWFAEHDGSKGSIARQPARSQWRVIGGSFVQPGPERRQRHGGPGSFLGAGRAVLQQACGGEHGQGSSTGHGCIERESRELRGREPAQATIEQFRRHPAKVLEGPAFLDGGVECLDRQLDAHACTRLNHAKPILCMEDEGRERDVIAGCERLAHRRPRRFRNGVIDDRALWHEFEPTERDDGLFALVADEPDSARDARGWIGWTRPPLDDGPKPRHVGKRSNRSEALARSRCEPCRVRVKALGSCQRRGP